MASLPDGLAEDLVLAYRATAYFLRRVDLLSDSEIDGVGAAPEFTPRRVTVARIGYSARMIATQADMIRDPDGVYPENPDMTELAQQIEHGASLPPRALRHLVYHSAVHLRVAWRDLPSEGWERTLSAQRGEVLMRETPWIRTKSLWLAAIELGSGASFVDAAPAVLQRMNAGGPGER